jgi:phosphotransacetylase
MPLAGFDSLFHHADLNKPQVPVVVAGGADSTVLAAMRQAYDRGWARPQLAGSEKAIRQLADQAAIDLQGLEILDTEDPAAAAVHQARSGRAQMLMKGQIATPALMQALLNPATGLRTGKAIGQVVLMEIVPAQRRFLLLDTGICIAPTLEQKADLLRSAVAIARRLGADMPRVAVMAATESVSAAMPETGDAAELQRRGAAGDFPGCFVQGPLSFDLAYAADAADKKRVAGSVCGAADVMLFPSLAAANLTVKAIMYTAACRFGGVLCGTACPVLFMSRADSVATRLHSLAFSLSQL